MDKSPDAFRTISEVAEELDLPQHVLRFWETRFSQIKPMKRTGGRRYYRPEDIELVRAIKALLYGEGYTIKGVQRLFKENGMRSVVASVRSGAPPRPSQPALDLDDEAVEPHPAAETAQQATAAPASAIGTADPAFPAPRDARLAEMAAEIAAELAECARILRAARAT